MAVFVILTLISLMLSIFFLLLPSSSFWSVFLFLFYFYFFFWNPGFSRKGLINSCLSVCVWVHPSETIVTWNPLISFFKKIGSMALILMLCPQIGPDGRKKNFFAYFGNFAVSFSWRYNLKLKIILLVTLHRKLMIWQNYCSQAMGQGVPRQSDCRIFRV